MKLVLATFVLCVLLGISSSAAAAAVKDLYIINICRERLGDVNVSKNVDFALELVNSHPDVLPGYRVHASHTFVPGMSLGLAMKAFMDDVWRPPTKLAILGPSFSGQAEALAQTARYYNLVEVGSTLTSPVFSDVTRYPLLARTIMSTIQHNPAMLAVMEHFKWRKVATITEDVQFVIPAVDDLHERLEQDNITVLASATFSSDPAPQIKQLKDSGAKILLSFLAQQSPDAKRTFCRAYQQGLYGHRYQWIHWSLLHGISYEQFSSHTTDDGCTTAQMQEAIEGTITFISETASPEYTENTVGVSGYTTNQLRDMYKDFVARDANHPQLPELLFGQTFDAVWTLALAMNASMDMALENFTYDNSGMAGELMRNILQGQFLGMSGSVSFDSRGGRNSRVLIHQFQGGVSVVIGAYDPVSGTLEWSDENSIYFKDGKPPADSVHVIIEIVKVKNAIFYTLSAVAGVGVIMSAVCLTFNMYYRNTSLIKLSSPRINNIIAAGCCLFFASIVLIGLDYDHVDGNSYICTVRVWVLICGFTLTFSSLFAKTWRVHAIFTNKMLKKKSIKDIHLVAIVGLVLLADVIILVLWAVIDPFRWEIRHLQEIYDENDQGIMYIPEFRVCTSSKISNWLGAFYAFKALLMVFGIFFAWETRKVKVEALNDSKQIGMCIYNVMILTVISVILISLLPVEQVTVGYVVVSISIIVCASSTLALVFGSKMYTMIQHGHQVDISTASKTGTNTAASNARSSAVNNSTHGDSQSAYTISGQVPPSTET